MIDLWKCSAIDGNDTCGWIAAIVAMVCFGTFGVPIKGDAANSVDIDPLVMQSYKTIMCFVTSWVVLPLEGFTFTPWGIVSGLFWVPSGVMAIYAIRNAGLAVSQGTWSSIIVLVSFVWGVFIFNEHVKSKLNACFAILLMMMGLWGMSYYSAPTEDDDDDDDEQGDNLSSNPVYRNVKHDDMFQDEAEWYDRAQEGEEKEGHTINFEASSAEQQQRIPGMSEDSNLFAPDNGNDDSNKQTGLRQSNSFGMQDGALEITDSSSVPLSHPSFKRRRRGKAVICCFGSIKISRRKAGILSACMNGIWGGSVMVPMHYSGGNTGGLRYAISFAIGASIITVFLWILRYCYHLHKTKFSFRESFLALPSFHVRVMWLPGGTAGLLWSVGNILSMISVQQLGEGVGYSVIQASMFVSGLWGIFWYREVQRALDRIKWLLAAFVTLTGILLLGYEHRT